MPYLITQLPTAQYLCMQLTVQQSERFMSRWCTCSNVRYRLGFTTSGRA